MFKKNEAEELINIGDVFNYSYGRWQLIKDSDGLIKLKNAHDYIYIEEQQLPSLIKLLQSIVKLREMQKQEQTK